LETAIGYFRGGSVVKEELKQNGKPLSGLTPEQRQQLRERHLAEQEAQMEQAWLVYCAAKAAVEAVRREIEGSSEHGTVFKANARGEWEPQT
jgi:hypothetical protein